MSQYWPFLVVALLAGTVVGWWVASLAVRGAPSLPPDEAEE